MRQFRHIGTRQLALVLGLMIVSLMLAPPGSIAQTDKSGARSVSENCTFQQLLRRKLLILRW
jgi:hypothetical protein